MSTKKRGGKPQKDYFIDEEHDEYKKNPLVAIDTKFDGNEADIQNFYRLYFHIVDSQLHAFTVGKAFKAAYELASEVELRVRGVDTMFINFGKGSEGVDTASMKFAVQQYPHYFMYPYFGYYQNPNQVHYAYFVRDYKTTLGGILKPLKSTAVGYKWNYAKNESLYYFQQTFKNFWNDRIRTIYQETTNGRGIESCVNEKMRKSSLRFEVDLHPQDRPSIFRHSFVTDPDNYGYLKFSVKKRKNNIDKDHCSRLLMDRAINNDSLASAKVGIKINKAYDQDYMMHNLSFKATQEVASNFTESSFAKTKVFARYSQPISDTLYVQSSISGGYIKNLRSEELKVNDTFYLKNFKGIRNIGYHYEKTEDQSKDGIKGQNIGFDRYLNFTTKIAQVSAPLLGDVNIEPFAHVNIALAPNKDVSQNPQSYEGKNFLNKYGRLALGFGASLQLSGLAIECYYNPVVIKQKNEIKSEFQINIGID